MAAPRRLDAVVVLAVVLPVVVAASLALVRGSDPAPAVEEPERAPLSQLSIVCPTPVGRPAGEVRVTRVPGVDGGHVQARLNRNDRLQEGGEVPAGATVTTVPDSRDATVVTGRGAAAPGLVAGRDESGAAPECREPWYDDWFVGLGATARESTVIELINPDPAAAVVDIEVHGPDGPIEDASWRGVTVAGHGVTWVRLSERPVRSPVAAHVTVARGRVAAFARHTADQLGRTTPTTDYVPAQAAPSEENLLLGVPTSGPQRWVFLANPGDDEVRATVRVVTGEATLVPAGSTEVAVPPRSQAWVRVADYLDAEAAAGALGLLVESTGPLAAGVRGVVDGDLTALSPVTAHEEPMVAVVPTGAKTLLAGAATRAGTVRVTAVDERGRRIWDEKRVAIAAGHAVELELPRRTVRVEVVGHNTPVAATILVDDAEGRGAVRLSPARTHADVPAVTPAP